MLHYKHRFLVLWNWVGMPNEKAVHVLMYCTIPKCNSQSNTGLMSSGCQFHQESNWISAGQTCLNLCNLLHRERVGHVGMYTHMLALCISLFAPSYLVTGSRLYNNLVFSVTTNILCKRHELGFLNFFGAGSRSDALAAFPT